MKFSDGSHKTKNFEMKRISNEKILISIPVLGQVWEKEYSLNDPINQIFIDFKAEKGIDIPDDLCKSLKINKNSLDSTYKIKIFFGNENTTSNLVGKPFNNPFEVFIFNRNTKLLNIQTFDNRQIQSLGLNHYGPSSAYCNGNNHLYISGGETNKNEINDQFFDINLTNNNIEGPYNISPKKNHSMIFISPDKVFVVGGNDKKVFYFDTKEKQFIDLNDLNIIRTEPALQIIGNILYCFDNVNKADNEQLSFEKIDINNPYAEWELIYPIINTEKFPQKFFAVSKDNAGENIIFLGGNMDDNIDSKDLKNYRYNIESNSIEETNIPFLDFNYKEKTFLTYNKNVEYLLPDFNRKHPIVTFYVKNKQKFEKINYLPKTEIKDDENYIQKNKYVDSKYDFNMPLIQSSNVEIPIKENIKMELKKNLPGINEPSFEKIDLENKKIDQEPTFKEPEIEPNRGDQQIDLEIPNKFGEYSKGKITIKNNKNISEEEKNAEEYPVNNSKFKFNGNSYISGSFNLMNNGSNNQGAKYEINNFHPSVNIPENQITGLKNIHPIIPEEDSKGNLKGSFNLNPEISIGNMPRQEGINLEDINIKMNEPINVDIKAQGMNPGLNGKDVNLNENISIENNIKPKIDIKKDINVEKLDTKIPNIEINGDTKDLEGKASLQTSQKFGFLLGGTIPGNKEKDSKKPQEFNMYGIISGSKNYKSKINTDINAPELKGKGININMKTPNLNMQNPNINIKGNNIDFKNDLGLKAPTIDGKSGKLKVGGNVPGVDINIQAPNTNGNIDIPKIEGQNINAEIPEVGIDGKKFDAHNQGININVGADIQKPELNVPKIEAKNAGIEIDGNVPNFNINNQNIDTKLVEGKDLKISGPGINIKGDASKIKQPKFDFGLSGIIPGNNYIDEQNIKGSRRLYGSHMNIDFPETNIKGSRLHFKTNEGELKGSRRLDINMKI